MNIEEIRTKWKNDNYATRSVRDAVRDIDELLTRIDELLKEVGEKERLIKDIIASNREWLAMFTKDLDEAGKENHALRHILWTSHGCRGCNSVPYMVCNETEHPPIDFISDKPDDILDKLWHKAFDKSKFPPERWNVITTSCADCKLNAQLQSANEELRRENEGLKDKLGLVQTVHQDDLVTMRGMIEKQNDLIQHIVNQDYALEAVNGVLHGWKPTDETLYEKFPVIKKMQDEIMRLEKIFSQLTSDTELLKQKLQAKNDVILSLNQKLSYYENEDKSKVPK